MLKIKKYFINKNEIKYAQIRTFCNTDVIDLKIFLKDGTEIYINNVSEEDLLKLEKVEIEE